MTDLAFHVIFTELSLCQVRFFPYFMTAMRETTFITFLAAALQFAGVYLLEHGAKSGLVQVERCLGDRLFRHESVAAGDHAGKLRLHVEVCITLSYSCWPNRCCFPLLNLRLTINIPACHANDRIEGLP
jgi:hypothetical protein